MLSTILTTRGFEPAAFPFLGHALPTKLNGGERYEFENIRSVWVSKPKSQLERSPGGNGQSQRAFFHFTVDSQIVHQGFVSNESNEVNGSVQGQKVQPKAKTDPDSWNCTIRQRGLILSILERNDLDPEVVEDLADDLCGKPMSDLNKGQVSSVITEVLDRWGRHPKANGREKR